MYKYGTLHHIIICVLAVIITLAQRHCSSANDYLAFASNVHRLSLNSILSFISLFRAKLIIIFCANRVTHWFYKERDHVINHVQVNYLIMTALHPDIFLYMANMFCVYNAFNSDWSRRTR